MKYSLPVVVTLALLASSCNYAPHSAEDSWQHYQSGGNFSLGAPSLSADGRVLVYVSPFSGHGDICAIDSRIQNPRRLTANDDFESWPILSGDGTRIAFVREHDGVRHLWIMNSDGSNQTQLTDGNVLDDLQSVSKDGRYVLFNRSLPTGGQGRSTRAYLLRTDQSLGQPVSVGVRAVLAADADTLMYSEDGELWRMGIGNGEKRRLKSLVVSDQLLDASADGQTVLLSRMPKGEGFAFEQEILALDTSNGSERSLGTGNSAVLFGTRGEYVFYYAGFDQVPAVVPTAGGKAMPILGAAGHKSFPRVCFNGRGVVMSAVRSREEGYDVLFLDSDTMSCKTIASINATSVNFSAPEVTKGDTVGNQGAELPPPREPRGE